MRTFLAFIYAKQQKEKTVISQENGENMWTCVKLLCFSRWDQVQEWHTSFWFSLFSCKIPGALSMAYNVFPLLHCFLLPSLSVFCVSLFMFRWWRHLIVKIVCCFLFFRSLSSIGEYIFLVLFQKSAHCLSCPNKKRSYLKPRGLLWFKDDFLKMGKKEGDNDTNIATSCWDVEGMVTM